MLAAVDGVDGGKRKLESEVEMGGLALLRISRMTAMRSGLGLHP